jgi:hypothetical protein
MIEAGLIDAALVGGVDSLCLTTLYGFHSLQLSSPRPVPPLRCRARRHLHRRGRGIRAARTRAGGIRAERLGAAARCRRIERRLSHVGAASGRPGRAPRHAGGAGRGGLEPGDIDYINLHGTGTPSNDRSESQAVTGVFGAVTPCSSTKGATGHTLGAAGALEAVISALAIEHGLMPGGVHTGTLDPTLTALYISDNRTYPARARAQQFIRLRRHELQPDFRPRRMTLSAYVDGIGVLGPGLPNWPEQPRCLSGREPYRPPPAVLPVPAILPAAERRRTAAWSNWRSPWPRKPPPSRRDPATGERVLLVRRRRPQLPRALPGARRGPRDLADALRQLGAQRRRRLLEHRDGAVAVERAVRVRREFRRGSARGAGAGGGRSRAGFAGGLRHGVSAAAACQAPVPDAFGVGPGADAADRGPGRSLASDAALTTEAFDRLPDPSLEELRAAIPAARCLPLLRAAGHAQRRPMRARVSRHAAHERATIEPCV